MIYFIFVQVFPPSFCQKKAASCENVKNALDMKASNMESFKIKSLEADFSSQDKSDDISTKSNASRFPETEETYMQQSKRSMYYQKCKNIFQSIKHWNEQTVSNNHVEDSHSSNPLYSPSFESFLLTIVRILSTHLRSNPLYSPSFESFVLTIVRILCTRHRSNPLISPSFESFVLTIVRTIHFGLLPLWQVCI